MRGTAIRITSTSAGAGRSGMTLLEVLTVMVVIGIIAAIGLPRIDYSRYRADAAVQMVRGTLQQAQRNAIQRQHDIVVSFDVPGRRVRVLEDANNNRQRDGAERALWRPLEEGARFAAPPAGLGGATGAAAVNGPNLRTLDGMPSITFHANGSASTDAQVYVTSARAQESDFRAIQVTQATGRVDWFRRTGSAWRRPGV